MSLTSDGLSGLVLSTTALPSCLPLDTVLTGTGRVVALASSWWRRDWVPGADLFVLDGAPVSDEFGWRLDRKDDIYVHFLAPEVDAEKIAVLSGRLDGDVDRSTYLEQLRYLGEALDADFALALSEWVALVNARPIIDPVEMLRQVSTAHRPVGVVPVLDQDSVITDVLVIDDRGAAATAHGNSWLESIGSQWSSHVGSDQPELVEFLGWVATQNPTGPVSLGAPYISSGAGTVEAIALQSLQPIV